VNTGSSKHGNSSGQIGGQYGESILSFTLIKETRARETQRASGSNRTIVGLKGVIFVASHNPCSRSNQTIVGLKEFLNAKKLALQCATAKGCVTRQ
jgi:hypothetical protein